jgi:hypothetical protein
MPPKEGSQKGDIDPNVEKVIEHLRSEKEKNYEKRTNNGQVNWLRPPDWDADLQTVEAWQALHAAFNTDKAEEWLNLAFEKDDPGNSCDGILLTLQINYMAQMERAYRARVGHSVPRALAHVSTREKGHGQQFGALKGLALEYFKKIKKQGSQGTA